MQDLAAHRLLCECARGLRQRVRTKVEDELIASCLPRCIGTRAERYAILTGLAAVVAERWYRKRLPAIIPLAERLAQRKKRIVLHMWNDCKYRRTKSPGGHVTMLDLAAPRAFAEGGSTLEWGRYSKACKYPARESRHDIRLRPDWFARVYRTGLASIGHDYSTFILDAVPISDGPPGHEKFAVRYVRQGAGFSLRIVDCFVMRQGPWCAWGNTTRSAATKLNRVLSNAVQRSA